MATEGPNNPATVVNDASVGAVNWSTPANVTTSDNAYATAAAGAGVETRLLKATNFLFGLPAGAVVDGILAEWERSGADGVDNVVRLVKGGAVVGTNKPLPGAWPGADAYASYGGPTDLWGETWTDVDINAVDFGAALSATLTAAGSVKVDHVRITVYYSVPGEQPVPRCHTARQVPHPGYANE